MAAPKTIVITLPKQLNGTPMMLPAPSATTTAIASKQLTDLLAGNFVQVIKEEIPDKMLDDTGKPPRKRQRLDHLTMEEKIMRRKLKNRVAAQTARDRKKMRMDQLEAQLSELSEHVTEVDKLNAILTEQNAELASKKEVLEMMLSKCICGLGSQMEEEEEEDDCTSETQKPNVFEGVVIPVSTQIVGSAAGNQCAGSNKDHGSQCTLLPMGRCNSYDPLEDGSEQFGSQHSITHSVTEVSEETLGQQQMVGTSSTGVESSWDVADHDYTKGCQTQLNMNLTAAEDDLIMQLTNALGRGNPSSTEQLSQDDEKVMAVHVLDQNEELATPDILKDFLDFENATRLPRNTDNRLEANQNLLCIGQQSTVRAPSPISKAQILDFLQDKMTIPSPGSSGSSESGYESALSPKSVDSLENNGSFEYTDELIEIPMPLVGSPEVDEDSGFSLDTESFNELFPSLF